LLRARLKQTIVAAVGVTFSIAMFIALVSFMNGLNEMLDGLMLNRTPHILLYNEVKPSENQPLGLSEDYKRNEFHSVHKTKRQRKSIYNSVSIIKTLKQDKRIDVAAKVTASVLFNSGTIEISGFINGIDIVAEDKLFKISDYIREGKVTDLSQNNIIIGKVV
jgi:lipoprotein-releasing system permease protein